MHACAVPPLAPASMKTWKAALFALVAAFMFIAVKQPGNLKGSDALKPMISRNTFTPTMWQSTAEADQAAPQREPSSPSAPGPGTPNASADDDPLLPETPSEAPEGLSAAAPDMKGAPAAESQTPLLPSLPHSLPLPKPPLSVAWPVFNPEGKEKRPPPPASLPEPFWYVYVCTLCVCGPAAGYILGDETSFLSGTDRQKHAVFLFLVFCCFVPGESMYVDACVHTRSGRCAVTLLRACLSRLRVRPFPLGEISCGGMQLVRLGYPCGPICMARHEHSRPIGGTIRGPIGGANRAANWGGLLRGPIGGHDPAQDHGQTSISSVPKLLGHQGCSQRDDGQAAWPCLNKAGWDLEKLDGRGGRRGWGQGSGTGGLKGGEGGAATFVLLDSCCCARPLPDDTGGCLTFVLVTPLGK